MRNLGLCICITLWALCSCEDKRAPSGFTALRGKKDSEDALSVDYLDKRPPFDLALQNSPDNWTPFSDFDVYKRLPSGFFGLRGKKDLEEDAFEKRAPPSGFWGMRGKKEYDPFYDPKRAPESRFFGMRGKRQPNRNSFFGMRGKKFDVRGKFVGVRGKKSYEGDAPYFGEDEGEDVGLDQLIYLLRN